MATFLEGSLINQAEDPRSLMRAVDRSLGRLRTDHLDVMMFHGVIPVTYHTVVERLYPIILRLRESGKVRFVGLSTRFIDDPKHDAALMAVEAHPQLWDAVMLKYGILNQYAAKRRLPAALANGVGVLNMAAVRVKLPRPDLIEALIADWKRRGLVSPNGVPREDPLGWLVHDDIDSVVSAAYRFAADHPAVSTVLSGTSSIEHLETNAAALERPFLPEADKRRLVDLFGEIAVAQGLPGAKTRDGCRNREADRSDGVTLRVEECE